MLLLIGAANPTKHNTTAYFEGLCPEITEHNYLKYNTHILISNIQYKTRFTLAV